MLTVHLQSFSPFFPLVFSLFLGPISECRIILFSLSLPDGAEYLKMVTSFFGSKRCCCCSQLLCRCRDHPLLLLLPLSLESKNPPRRSRSFSRSGLLGLDDDGGSEADCFYLRDRKRDLVPLLVTKAHKDMCTLRVSLPGKLAGFFH